MPSVAFSQALRLNGILNLGAPPGATGPNGKYCISSSVEYCRLPIMSKVPTV